MKAILIRDLPDQTLENLKWLAKYHHRSLQGELHSILEEVSERTPRRPSRSLRIKTVNTGNQGTWKREEIYGDEAR
ncbi:MAG: hypothetical protein DRP60_12785 [Spirochaetes bacterium]|nr:MAG: hypothetical protein DRP60_12785 [Spirochaetota bacterium]